MTNYDERCNSKDWNVRCGVAADPRCPSHLLEKLSKDTAHVIRWYVAKNMNSPIHILEKLSLDNDFKVRRYGVCRNPKCNYKLKEAIENLHWLVL